MKRYFPMIVALFLSLVGIGMFFYPNVSDWYIQHHQEKIIQNYGKKTKRLSRKVIEKEKQKIRAYNRSLLENKTMLIDPFHTKKIGTSKKIYKQCLSFDSVIAYVEIPKIKVYLPVYHGTSEKTLEKGLGHLEGTSLPLGEKGSHCVISGHSGLPSAFFFTDLEKLERKDIFYIYVLDEVLAYQVDEIRVVNPDDISFFRIDPQEDYVTLVTCTPFGQNTHRLLVRGRRRNVNRKTWKRRKEKIKKSHLKKRWIQLLGVGLGMIMAIGVVIYLKRRLKVVH